MNDAPFSTYNDCPIPSRAPTQCFYISSRSNLTESKQTHHLQGQWLSQKIRHFPTLGYPDPNASERLVSRPADVCKNRVTVEIPAGTRQSFNFWSEPPVRSHLQFPLTACSDLKLCWACSPQSKHQLSLSGSGGRTSSTQHNKTLQVNLSFILSLGISEDFSLCGPKVPSLHANSSRTAHPARLQLWVGFTQLSS